MHYFRIPRVYWRDRLEKVKAAGLNTVCTYVEWSLHEPSSSIYDFTGEADLLEYLRIAKDVGLNVILRPGPYICAERDFGGYPAWLLTMNPNMKLRTSDPTHTFFVARWFRVLFPKLQPFLYGNGGNIIMVQVENEYGSYPVNDLNYLLWLRDLFQSYIGNNAVLFTTDGRDLSMITRGKIPGVFSTIDFGPTAEPLEAVFRSLRKVQPKGPLVNSEFYVGWITYWGKDWVRTDTAPIISTMEEFLKNNVSFSMYMIHGGSNFGFSAGSGSDDHYIADVTSYDYDAPITEAGDLSSKYEAIRKTILDYHNISTPLTIPLVKSKGNYGKVELIPVCSLFNCPIGIDYPSSKGPISFEALGQRYGFVSYSTSVNIPSMDPSVLQVTVRDRAVVYLDDKEVGVLQYTVINELPLPPTYRAGQTLRLLIENMGRRNFQRLSDCTKGLISNATVDGNILKNWEIKGYPLNPEDIAKLDNISPEKNVSFPAVFRGQFVVPEEQGALDTFVSLDGWGKGVVFVNEFNLGRYWKIGPQVTLYVPANYLRAYPVNNTITVIELHYAHPNATVEFFDAPVYRNRI